MKMSSFVHHVGLKVINEKPVLHLFVNQLGFQHYAYQETEHCKKWVLCRNSMYFIVTTERIGVGKLPSDTHYNISQSHNEYMVVGNNTVYEVAFEVSNVHEAVKIAVEHGSDLIEPIKVLSGGDHGTVYYASIASCVGNVVHSFYNKQNYRGHFLPGFTAVCGNARIDDYSHNNSSNKEDRLQFAIDHITLCVGRGKTESTLYWYEEVFGMTRLLVNKYVNSQHLFYISLSC